MKLITSIYDRYEIWPFFVNYYWSQGVSQIYVNLWDDTPDLRTNILKYKPESLEIFFQTCAYSVFNAEDDAAAHNGIRESWVGPDEWYVVADLDEFHCLKTCTLLQAVSDDQLSACDFIGSTLIDRFSDSGRIPIMLSFEKSLGHQFPVELNITGGILKACSRKIVAARGRIPVRAGHHSAGGTRSTIQGETHHFKWFGNFSEVVTSRLSCYRSQGLFYSDEPERWVRYFSKTRGQIDFSDPDLSARSLVKDPFSRVFSL